MITTFLLTLAMQASAPAAPIAIDLTRPLADKLNTYYPRTAARDDIEKGMATVECALRGDGRMTHCRILSEQPNGEGFGNATLDIIGREVQTDPAKAVAGQLYDITIHWAFSCSAKDKVEKTGAVAMMCPDS